MTEAESYLQPDLDDGVPVDDAAEPEDAVVEHLVPPEGIDDGS